MLCLCYVYVMFMLCLCNIYVLFMPCLCDVYVIARVNKHHLIQDVPGRSISILSINTIARVNSNHLVSSGGGDGTIDVTPFIQNVPGHFHYYIHYSSHLVYNLNSEKSLFFLASHLFFYFF